MGIRSFSKQENYVGRAACCLKLQNPGTAAHPVTSKLIKNTDYIHPGLQNLKTQISLAPKALAEEPKKPVKTKPWYQNNLANQPLKPQWKVTREAPQKSLLCRTQKIFKIFGEL
ncbi:hypothetical protein H1R20_g15758, partial [Candolleomyces eurysporus]